jgi:hypothetical protein
VSGRSNGHHDVSEGGWWDGYEYHNISNHGWRGVLHVVGPGTSASYPSLGCEAFSSIRDGTSTTLMIGELHHPILGRQRKENRGTFWSYSYTSYNSSQATPFSATLLTTDWRRCIDGVPSDNLCKRGWGAFHPGAINFSLADGSVVSIPTTIDMNLFCALASIDGGEPEAQNVPGR